MTVPIGNPVFAWAADKPVIPNFWDSQERFIKPNVKSMPRLRFLTTTDFPPFSFIDQDKRLSGFHVDMARAICRELDLLDVCQMQALPFDELETALNDGSGDAIMAGINIEPQTRARLAFSRAYFQLPARFMGKKGSGLKEPLAESLGGKTVGVVDGTAHAEMAKAGFGSVVLRLFDTRDAALDALTKDEIAAVFADGLDLSFWLQSSQKNVDCCEFVGGPYLSRDYLGNGLAIAVKKDNHELEDALNYALRALNDDGTFAELYLRYFPLSLY